MTNAEAMGNEDARLHFSNDEVETPAYVVLGVFDYLRATGDAVFAESVFDMVIWALEVQTKHLRRGMTGFSGDETYIAGHIFPRPPVGKRHQYGSTGIRPERKSAGVKKPFGRQIHLL